MLRVFSAAVCSPPSVQRMTSRWSMRSSSSSRLVGSPAMSEVVRPRAETYSGTCQPWFTQGVRASRTLPMTWVQSCRVSAVGRSSA
jgi:hypothetical protein